MDNFEEYLESIDEERKCSFFSLPANLTVGQATRLYEKYLILLNKNNTFLINETKRRLKILSYYPDYWIAINAFQVEELICYQTND